MKTFSLWYKKDNGRKWVKSSLSMKNLDALWDMGGKLSLQENWSDLVALDSDLNPNNPEDFKKIVYQTEETDLKDNL